MRTRTIAAIGLCLSLATCASSQKKIEQARGKDPQYQYNLGLFHLNNNTLEEALRYLNRSLALDPRNHLVLNALGLLHSMKGNLEEAVNMYQKCLVIAPHFSEGRNNLGTVYQELGYIDKAEEEFTKVTRDPNYANKELPYFNLARLNYLRQDWDKARSLAEMAVKLNSRFALAHNLIGLILENQNKIPEAIERYKQAIKIVPDDLNFNYNLGVAYFKNNELTRAGEIFEKIQPLVTDSE
ncbi:MAG: tetratricopeptide repeat protein, partial [Acidobacteriota bacterium]